MEKLKYFILFSTLILQISANGDLPQSEVVNFKEYIDNVYEMLMLDMEEYGFCNLRMRDFDLEIEDTYYGEHLKGKVKYFNGFMNHLDDTTATKHHSRISNDSFATIGFELSLKVFNFSYDAFGEINDQSIKGTGFFEMNYVTYTVTILKHLITQEITSTISFLASQPAKVQRLRFHKRNMYLAAMSRAFRVTIKEVGDSFRDWMEILSQLLQHIVIEKIQFPEIDYYTG